MGLCSNCRSEMARFHVGSVVLGTSCLFALRNSVRSYNVSLLKGDNKRNANKSIPQAPDSISKPRLSLFRRGLVFIRTLFTRKRNSVRLIPPQPQPSTRSEQSRTRRSQPHYFHSSLSAPKNLPRAARMVKQIIRPVKP